MVQLQTNLATSTPQGSPTSPNHAEMHNRLAIIANGIRNVQDLGAVGDGVTDDYAALQAAIDACVTAGGGGVYCPRGTYLCGTGLVIPNTVSVVLYGAGWGSIITGTATPLLQVTGGTNLAIMADVRDLHFLVPGAQTGVKYSGTENAAGNSGMSLRNVFIEGTGTSTQILLNYTGMQSTSVVRDCAIKNLDASNDCTGVLLDGATSAVMGLAFDHCTVIAKRGINCNGSGDAPNDIEGLTICGGSEISGTSYGLRIAYDLAVRISDTEFTGGGTCLQLDGFNNTVQCSNVYMDVGMAAPIVHILTVSHGDSDRIKFTGCHFEGNGYGDDGIWVNSGAASIDFMQVNGCDFHNLRTCIDLSTGTGEVVRGAFTGNTFSQATTGIALGVAGNRTGHAIIGNTFASDVTNPITGTRTGNTIENNTGDDVLGEVWTAYAPTITAGSGSFTTRAGAGRYRVRGKSLEISIKITITTNGTANAYVICPLPSGFTSCNGAVAYALSGFTDQSLGLFGACNPNTSAINIQTVTATYPGADGRVLNLSGVIELA